MTFEDMLAKDEVRALVLRYARALDERAWNDMRELFTDTVEIDAAGIHGGPAVELTRDQWVARARSTVELFEVTLHYLTNLEIDLTGDSAVCRSYSYAVHGRAGARPSERFVVHGVYTHGATRTPKGWRLSRMKLDFMFRDGEIPKRPA